MNCGLRNLRHLSDIAAATLGSVELTVRKKVIPKVQGVYFNKQKHKSSTKVLKQCFQYFYHMFAMFSVHNIRANQVAVTILPGYLQSE